MVLDLPASAFLKTGEILARYTDLELDFTDAAIVWLADNAKCRAILTVDVRDFTTFRLQKNRRFELLQWF
jgi:predicted nucleic acid-binding protein